MKKIGFYIIMLLMIAVFVETMAQLTYYVIYKQRYAATRLKSAVNEKNEPVDQVADALQNEVIHPYVGFVFDYGDPAKNQRTYGFSTKNAPLVKKEAGKINVVLLGGSVANGLAEYLGPFLEKTFKDSPRIITLALPGGKEPQQLFALAYFLALGAEYEVVINVDGFNEIALPYLENYTAGVNPFFPRSWKMRFTRKYDMGEIALVGKIKYLRELRQEALASLNTSIFRKSAIFGLIRTNELERLHRQILKNTLALNASQHQAANRFEESGPFYKYNSPEDCYRECADVWERTSLLINAICQQNRIEYYHFLQPNQYYDNSKKFTAEEKRNAFLEDHPMRDPVQKGYPLLLNRSNMLLKNNVRFYDSTMLFANVKETIYIDNCCHYNKEGNELLSDYIVQKIREVTRLQVK